MMPTIFGQPTAPYPALPEPLAQRHDARQWRLRPFGTRGEDLQVDLTADRPTAITELLACCTLPEPDRDVLWDLPVGKRIECLLILAALHGLEAFDAEVRCPRCDDSFEVTLTTGELLDPGRAIHRTVVEVRTEGGVSRFRVPTGRDQLAWLGQVFPDEKGAIQAVMARLVVAGDGHVPVAYLEAAFDEADPLLRAPVASACPNCGCEVEGETDLAGTTLARLSGAQDSMIEEIDLLASRYHWSEAEILSMPGWRRARYVDRQRRERP